MSTLERKHLTEPSPSDWERIEQLVIQGEHPYTAARKHGFTLSALRRANREWHAYLLELARDEDRSYVRAKLRENVDQAMRAVPVFDREGNETGEYTYEGQVANKALELLGKDAGMFTERVEVEHTGAVEVVVEHDYDRLLDKLASVGLVQRGPATAADTTIERLLPARTD